MADPTVVTTGEKPGLLQGVWKAIGDKGLQEAADLAELESRKTKALSSLPPGTRLSGLGSGQPSEPTTFAVESPGVAGWLDTLNPVTPSKTVTVGPAVAAPEAVKEAGVKATPGYTDRLANQELPQPTDADMAGAGFGVSGGGTGGTMQAATAGAGGYKAPEVALPVGYENAAKRTTTAVNDLAAAQKELQDNPERQKEAAANTQRLTDATAAEAARSGRLATLGGNQKTLNDKIASDTANFKVDPERLYGQGAERAGKTFGLALANVFSNVGEAMQGKVGTNAILGLIRDRVAQDIALQEADYKRMLQGYEVQRNGLMDAIAMVGTERGGAEALAKQQALGYVDRLKFFSQNVTGKEQRLVLEQTIAAAETALADKQYAVGKTNAELLSTQRQSVAHNQTQVAIADAHNKTQVIMKQAELDAGQARASAAFRMGYNQLTDADRVGIDKNLSEDTAKGMGGRRKALDILKESVKDPAVAAAFNKFSVKWLSSYTKGIDSGMWAAASEGILNTLARSDSTPAELKAIQMLRLYDAARLVATGGKALTTNEINLLSFPHSEGPEQWESNLSAAYGQIDADMDSAVARGSATLSPKGGQVLAKAYRLLNPSREVTPPGAPVEKTGTR